MIDGPAVGLVDGDLLLVRVTDSQPGDVLTAREHAYQNTGCDHGRRINTM